MRLSLFAATLAALALATPVFAQAPAPTPTDRTKATVFTAEMLATALSKLPTERPSGAARVFTLPPYNVNVEQRQPRAQGASLHEAQAEFFYVIDGAAILVACVSVGPTRRCKTYVTMRPPDGP